MKVKVIRNFIYDGTFRKVGEVFAMDDDDARSYADRHWLEIVSQASRPERKKFVKESVAEIPDEIIDELPPLDVGRKKK